VSDLQTKIIFEEMPECEELLQMCEDIFLARQVGDVDLEYQLYRELVEVYRSPEQIIERTRLKTE
jgi:hypothetical protein